MREQFFTPLGLVTEPNKLGQYPPGAMAVADNLVMRAPGLLSALDTPTQLPGFDGFGGAGAHMHRVVSTGDQLIVWVRSTTGVWTVYWQTQSGDEEMRQEDVGTMPATFATDGRIASSLFRRRTVYNSEQGIRVVDYTNPTTFSERSARWAGYAQPLLSVLKIAPGQAVQRSYVVTYAATFEREYPPGDDYVLISEPSPLIRMKAQDTIGGGGDPETRFSTLLQVGFGWAPGRHQVREGDLIKIWRSPAVHSDADNLNTESGTTLYLAVTYRVTATDVGLYKAEIWDDAHEKSLTEELYTNPGQNGLDSARRRPPHAKTIAQYQGFTFYGNCTTPAQWTARLPYGLGKLNSADPTERRRGVGIRSFTGAQVAGSTSITGVSAADYVGLAVGQLITSGSYTSYPGPTITALPGGGVITVSYAANLTTAASTAYAVDTVELDGASLPCGDLRDLIEGIARGVAINTAALTGKSYSLLTNQTIAYRDVEKSNVFPGIYEHAQLTYDQGFAIEPWRFVQNNAQLTVRATNGQNYDPPVPTMGETAKTFYPKVEKNIAYWSWDQQPECVAPPNYTPVGNGEIYQCIRAGDCLLFFCSDGLHRLSGYGVRSSGIGAQWRVDAVDRTLILLAPWLCCALRDAVYAHTSRGLVELGSDGVRAELSAGIVGDLLRPIGHWTAEPFRTMAADDLNHEVWIQQCAGGTPGASENYIYNTYQRAFTRVVRPLAMCLCYVDFLDGMGVGANGPATAARISVHKNIGATGYEALTGDFQPLSANDPLHSKQWIDMSLVFADAVGAAITARWNGVAGASRVRQLRANDARANFGVPRNAPAVAATLSPGFQYPANAAQLVLRAVSLRYEPLSEQYLHR